MKFLRLPDPLLTFLFENEDILALDKPYGFNTHTNDSKIEHFEHIQDGLIEILEKQLNQKLYIIHRLDQTTTGVIIFGKTQEAAKKYAEFFFNRQVKKTYLFVTSQKSMKNEFLIDQEIVHKAKELQALTTFKLLQKSHSFELWQANPQTGRNHQIRIHAEAAGISLLGDEKYGGEKYSFLCLHNQKIEFPNGIVIQSRAPIYFKNLSLLKNSELCKILFEADRRQRLFAIQSKQCFKLASVNLLSHEKKMNLDHYGSYLVINWTQDSWTDQEKKIFLQFVDLIKKPLIVKFSNSSQTLFPSDSKIQTQENFWKAQENKIIYELQSDPKQPIGLFLNQRLQRNWVLNNSNEKSVLSLFSSNSGFSLAAALGGAQSVTIIESQKKWLNWTQKNFAINNLPYEKYDFLYRDSYNYLKQCLKKNIKYDLITCEIPTFAKSEKNVFRIESDLEGFLEHCFLALNKQGQILFSTAYPGLKIDDLRILILKLEKKLRIQNLEVCCILPSLDFELPAEKVILKSFLVTKM